MQASAESMVGIGQASIQPLAAQMLGLSIPEKQMASGKVLYPHQAEAVFSLFKECERARSLQLERERAESAGEEVSEERVLPCAVSQPTAAGKSIEFFRLAQEVYEAWGWRTLIICPTTTLVGQLKENAELELGPEWTVGQIGDGVCQFDSCRMVVSIAASLYGSGKSSVARLEKVLAENYELIIFDECHHVASKKWDKLFHAFRRRAQILVGFSATVMRGDNISVASDKFFARVVCYQTAGQLVEAGRLARCFGQTVETGIVLRNLGLRDYNPEDLERAVNTDELNRLTARSWKKWAAGRKTIVFCVSIAHARRMAEMFRAEGVAAEAVWGKGGRKGKDGKPDQAGMKKREKERIMRDFKEGRTQVLTNCNLLTEGFDVPEISCVVLCRPTTRELAAVFFPQAVGRATRLHPEKEYSIIIEMLFEETDARQAERGRADQILNAAEGEEEDAGGEEKKRKKPRSLIAESLGVDVGDLDQSGILSLDEQERLAKEKKRERERASLREAIQKLESVDAVQERFDVLDKLSYKTAHAWIPLGDKSFVMMLGTGGDFIEVVRESEFRWEILTSIDGRLDSRGYESSREEALRFADEWLDMLDMNRYLIDRDQGWRTLGPTSAQLGRARKLGLNVEVLKKLSRGRVSDLISSVRALEKKGAQMALLG